MRILAIDTTSDFGSLALREDGVTLVLGQQAVAVGGLLLIHQLLQVHPRHHLSHGHIERIDRALDARQPHHFLQHRRRGHQ